ATSRPALPPPVTYCSRPYRPLQILATTPRTVTRQPGPAFHPPSPESLARSREAVLMLREGARGGEGRRRGRAGRWWRRAGIRRGRAPRRRGGGISPGSSAWGRGVATTT